MAKVIVVLKIMPKDVNVDLDTLENTIKSEINPEKIEREPIAFGLTALKVTKFVEDAGGQVELLENKLKNIEDIGNVEVVELTRSL